MVCVRSLVPNEKKSADWAISSAVTAARGSSIIVPIGISSSTPSASATSAIVCSAKARNLSSSGFTDTRGIIISGLGSRPCFFNCAAAVAIARICITGRIGYLIARRTPRKPSMGFCSAKPSICSMRVRLTAISSASAPVASRRAISTSRARGLSKNSCRGGSSKRTMTGKPSIALNMPRKSPVCASNKSATAFSRIAGSSFKMKVWIICLRSPKNICSVRQRPIP